ncbi:MAG: Copper-sensing transcriptional repressor RicR [SAR92 bacterium MED-G29]|jgi:DNA-binding FrmR family transcriptional regulator|nr:MAG: Copper-sensing transcriptional repressor RicR [SAR92 bacterium MED-G29]|tara:strand:- start:870 stop:1133 length:264 start_codon:yes stop_codon:yes gene_type:complete
MSHSCHKHLIPNINRISGQVNGIAKMVDEGKYCIDILNQLKAAKSAIATVEAKILETHIEECVRNSMQSESHMDVKIAELVKILKRA